MVTAANTGSSSKKSVRYLKGIGPRKSELLQKLGITTIRDLCFFFPRRYEDRSRFQKISEVTAGSFVTLKGKIAAMGLKPLKKVKLIELWLQDESGVLPAIWFNQPYLKNTFQVGQHVILSGKVDQYQNRLQVVSPEYEIIESQSENDPIHTGRITPIYPLTEGLFQRSMRAVMKELVDQHISEEIEEYLLPQLIAKYQFLGRLDAIREVHFPTNYELLEKARTRIIFDEFFLLELKLLQRLNETKTRHKGISIRTASKSLETFSSHLKFKLTRDQIQAIQEILADVQLETPMHRLLQGEVGSGKTIVAAYLLQIAAENKIQSAVLVPTEILAEQHAATLRKTLAVYPTHVGLLTANVTGDDRAQILYELETGKIDVLIGTHALLQESVRFRKLGVVIIDEQHKFGVRQRAKLLTRDPRPHLLIMSSTPIPRTLGITLYGDLDISIIRELPKERKPIHTVQVSIKEKSRTIELVKKRILKTDEQAYILFPIIEETERLDLQAANQEYERLKMNEFKAVPIGLVHGKLPKDERDQVMQNFRSRKLKLLVTTSVIEVGIDNPNATMMIVEHADRFGLSQLHQIRGRIGRGSKKSICYLIADPKTEEAKKRLQIITQTNDGFIIAEEDLKLRGPGEFFGSRQSGFMPFRLADMVRDSKMLIEAREEVKKILAVDPILSESRNKLLKLAVE